jgi:hypothetical protein
VFLAARFDAALDHQGAGRPGGGDVAQGEGARRRDQRSRCCRLARIQKRGQLLDLQAHGRQGLPRLLRRLGHHQRQRLAAEVDLAGGEQRLVGDDAADLVLAGDVGGGEHRPDPGPVARRLRVQERDAAACHRRGQHGGVQQPGEPVQVVSEQGFTAPVEVDVVLLHGRSPGPTLSGKSVRKWAASRRRSSARL